MPRFFTENISQDTAVLTGEDAAHISRSLRMKAGDSLTICDKQGTDYFGVITSVSPEQVEMSISFQEPSRGEPEICVTLYQALPKGDKLELIVQKAVELGVCRIVPVLTHRCVSRPDPSAFEKKRARYQRISLEAAKQSGRGIVPEVSPLLDFSQAVDEMKQMDCPILFYEESRQPLWEILDDFSSRRCHTAAIFVGSEGGLELEEVEEAQAQGIASVSLGPRILRCETAPLAALSILMYQSGNL